MHEIFQLSSCFLVKESNFKYITQNNYFIHYKKIASEIILLNNA